MILIKPMIQQTQLSTRGMLVTECDHRTKWPGEMEKLIIGKYVKQSTSLKS